MPGLPQFIEPQRLADRNETLSGEIPLAGMPRLRELLIEPAGDVRVRLQFSRNEQGRVHIGGDYQASLKVACQRCLAGLTLEMSGPVDVSVVEEGMPLDMVDDGSEPITLTGDQLQVAGFIEDELLLGLPIAPMHAPGQCRAAVDGHEESTGKPNPFAALKNLKVKQD